MKKVKICFVGGGSYSWGPSLIRDIMGIPEVPEVEFRLLDTNLAAANLLAKLGRKLAKDWNRKTTFIPTKDQKEAYSGADFVLICISTGGLKAMEHDLKIPEQYGIFQTVGDTVGPGGWSRGLRNVPVFINIAETSKRYCPEAAILNYTNPMGTTTMALAENTDQPVVGLCHSIFSTIEILQKIFNLKSAKDLKFTAGGLNHLIWLLDLKVKGKDGFKLLKQKLKGRNLQELILEAIPDAHGYMSQSWIAGELFNEYGYLPYTGDRHTSEFFSRYLTPVKKNLKKYELHQTSIEERQGDYDKYKKRIKALIAGKETIEPEPSREVAMNLIQCIATGGEFVDVINVPNRGQITNLPMGTVVETFGLVNALGFAPISVGALPDPIADILMPHAVNQRYIVDAATTGDWELAYKALINDPACAHLTIPEIKKMGQELLEANKKLLPKFFKNNRSRKK